MRLGVVAHRSSLDCLGDEISELALLLLRLAAGLLVLLRHRLGTLVVREGAQLGEALVQEARSQMDPIPGLLAAKKWDSVRAILITRRVCAERPEPACCLALYGPRPTGRLTRSSLSDSSSAGVAWPESHSSSAGVAWPESAMAPAWAPTPAWAPSPAALRKGVEVIQNV